MTIYGEEIYTLEPQKHSTPDYIRQSRLDKDGTYYTIIFQHYPNGFIAQSNCVSEPCFLILNDINGTHYAFQDNIYLSPDYLMEKLGRGRITLSMTDIKNIKILIEHMRTEWRKNTLGEKKQ